MLDEATKRRIDNARQILVGKVPDPKAQVDQITTALMYKFMDDMDRQSQDLGGKPKFFTGKFEKYSWRKLLDAKLSGQERIDLYTSAINDMISNPKIPQLFRNIFKDAFLPYKDSKILSLFLKEIDEFTYDHSENLGDAFEYLLSVLGSQGDAGQFRTPRHIIDFIVKVVASQKNERILDPACGTAGFLISSFKYIYRHNSSLTPKEKEKIASNLVGYDISPDMVKLSLVNLYLHDFTKPTVHEYDTLTSEKNWDNNFDVILANPPFMTPRGGIRPHKRFAVDANRTEVLFVDYIAEHLRSKGRAGVIVPEGVIFQLAKAYKALRKYLVEEWGLWAVVSLPAGVFNPYSGVKTSILFLDKQRAEEASEILFVKVRNDGFDLGAQRRQIDKDDLPVALNTLDAWKQGKKKRNNLALWVKKGRIAKAGAYDLTGDRYHKKTDYSTAEWPMVELDEVATIGAGNSAPQNKELFKDGKYPFCRTSDVGAVHISDNFRKIQDFLNEEGVKGLKIHPKDTILIPKSGASIFLNHRVLLAVDSYVSSHLATVYADREKILPQFLFRCLVLVNAGDLISNQGYPSLRLPEISKIKIPLPPIEVQKEVVAEIDSYQKVIDGAKQVVANWEPRIKINPDWPMVELGSKVNSITPPIKIKKSDFSHSGKYPIVDQSKANIVGWSNDAQALVKSDKALVVFGDHTCIVKYFEEPFIQGADGVKILEPHDEVLPKYLYYLLKNRPLQSDGYKRHFSKLRRYKIPLPSLADQNNIVAEIEAEQKAVEECKKLISLNEQKIMDKVNEVWQ